MAGEKRKRPIPLSGGASVADKEVVSTCSTSNNNNTNNNNTSSSSTSIRRGRKRLQRGAKDKVYAERLAAGNDNFDAGVTNNLGGTDNNSHVPSNSNSTNPQKGGNNNTTVIRNANNRRRSSSGNTNTKKSQDITSQQSSNGSSSNNTKRGSSTAVRSSSSSSFKATTRKRSRPSGGRRKGDDGVQKIDAPPGWPFTAPSAYGTKKKKASSSSRGGNANASTIVKENTSQKQMKAAKSKSFISELPKKQPATHYELGKEESNENNNIARTTRKQSSNLAGRQKDGNCPAEKDDGDKLDATCSSSFEGGMKLQSTTKLQPTDMKDLPEASPPQSRHGKKGKAKEAPSSSTAISSKSNDWSCNRCTLQNSNRRKKCQACGTPRYLTVGNDGTFALDESHSSAFASAVASTSNNHATGGIAAEDPYIDDSAQQHEQSPEQQSGESSSSQQSSQLSAMIDAPVFTRSRRREHLSQSQHQPIDEEEGNSDAGDQSSQLQQQYEDESPSELKQWLQKRQNARREKRERKRSVKKKNGVGCVKVVKVRPMVAGEHVMLLCSEDCESTAKEGEQTTLEPQRVLEAVVPVSVLSRIEQCIESSSATEDEVPIEKGKVNANSEKDTRADCEEQEECISQDLSNNTTATAQSRESRCLSSHIEAPPNETTAVGIDDNATNDDTAKVDISANESCNNDEVDQPSNKRPAEEMSDSQANDFETCIEEEQAVSQAHDTFTTCEKEKNDCNDDLDADKQSDNEKIKQDHPSVDVDRSHNNIKGKECEDSNNREESCGINESNTKHSEDECTSLSNDGKGNGEELTVDQSCEGTKTGEDTKSHPPLMQSIYEEYYDTSKKEEGAIRRIDSTGVDIDGTTSQLEVDGRVEREAQFPTNQPSSQGAASVDSPFIPMTQNLPDFDYLSQVRHLFSD